METIILSNNLNSTDFLRTIAKMGKKEIGLYIYNELEFLNYILIKNGISINKEFISNKSEAYIYMRILESKYKDAVNVRDAINSYRDNEFGKVSFETLSDDFKKKKEIIIEAYNKYESYKRENNLYDKLDLVNFINDNIKTKLSTNLIIFNELKVSNLVNIIADKLFNPKYISISEYIKYDLEYKHITKAYGKTNEIDFIFNEISNKKLNLGTCQIILINSSDLIYVLEYVNRFNINYTSSLGIPLTYTNSGKLLKILRYMKLNNYGIDSYKYLFDSPYFNSSIFKDIFTKDNKLNITKYNTFIEYVGYLRLSFEDKRNIYFDLYDGNIKRALSLINEDINKGIPHFINKYSISDNYKELVINKLKNIEKENLGNDLYDDLLDTLVAPKISSNDSIHITTLENAFSSLRENVFIVGLDSKFPGSPSENYFIYDDEYKIDMYKSINIINSKKDLYYSFIKLCKNLYLSYSFFSSADLKEINPSSVIYEDTLKIDDNDIYSFTSSSLNKNKNAILEYENNKLYENNKAYINKSLLYQDYLKNKVYTASSFHYALEDDYEDFLFQNLLEINLDDKNDPFRIIEANTKGTIIHSVFEGFTKNNNLDELIDKALIEFDKYLKMKPAIIDKSIEREKENIVDIVKGIYNASSENKHFLSEVKMPITDVYGVKFAGTFDRIEKTKNNEYILVDYKTGSNVFHKVNDPVTCIQGLIYAYMAENAKDKNGNYVITDNGSPIKIKEVEFIYPSMDKPISINWDDTNKKRLQELMNEFLTRIDNFKYFTNTKIERAKYKSLISICEKENYNE